ncbi:YjcZ family sporulation protein [Halalkalibacter alkaliphilus]|nr:YjcZ family sporulation protein [Halalkalibacter alkaliphilus]
MYGNANIPPNMMAGANVPPNIPPSMVAGVMDTPMPYSAAPVYGYGYTAPTRGHGFILIVVLFILLIIVGCSFPKC